MHDGMRSVRYIFVLTLFSLVLMALTWPPPGSSSAGCQRPPTLIFRQFLSDIVSLEPQVRAAATDQKPPGDMVRRLSIVINTNTRQLTLHLDGQPLREYPVAVGTPETPTPIGYWHITVQDRWGDGFGARWNQLSVPWGTYGVHGTNKPGSIGRFASHGCVRMYNEDVIQLSRLIDVGTPVTIKGEPFSRYGERRRTIRPTHIGSDVMQMQQTLKQQGYYEGPVDGKFGSGTRKALEAFQRDEGLEVSGIVYDETYDALGIVPYENDPNLRP